MPPFETIPLIARAHAHAERTAAIDDRGSLRYDELLQESARAASWLLERRTDLHGARVAFLIAPGREYVVAQWGIFRAGGIAVPLCTAHPPPELDYVIGDSEAEILIADPEFRPALEPIATRRGLRLIATDELLAGPGAALPAVDPQRGAMLLYTSGTTGKPKGVLSTHAILAAQIQSVVQAWEWSASDRILHTLPLHHLHGILNLLCCALWSGASCEFLPRFDAERVWRRIEQQRELTLFMAVPTIYAKLVQSFEQAAPERRAQMSAGCRRLRLMVSGSAALPVAMLERWRAISGHTLLERYGMTEFGMGLGNPLHGERRPGHVGVPFPGVEARLVDDRGEPVAEGEPGAIEIKSDGVFREYWRNAAATRLAFTPDGWFKTGDVAVCERGSYRILGRESVDILKSGGFKISALEIEEALREHPAIAECAVLGVPDEVWGQRVAAAIVLVAGQQISLEELRTWSKQRIAPYKVPTLLQVLHELPRNPMGKVAKPELTALFAMPTPDQQQLVAAADLFIRLRRLGALETLGAEVHGLDPALNAHSGRLATRRTGGTLQLEWIDDRALIRCVRHGSPVPSADRCKSRASQRCRGGACMSRRKPSNFCRSSAGGAAFRARNLGNSSCETAQELSAPDIQPLFGATPFSGMAIAHVLSPGGGEAMQFQQVHGRPLRERPAIRTAARCNQSAGELMDRGVRSRFDILMEAQARRDREELELHDGWQPIRPRTHGGTR